MTKAQQTERAEAIERLREWVKPGDTIYCVLRHVSQSGMLRVIDLKHIQCAEGEKEPRMLTLGYNAALALGMKYDRSREGVKIGGCGMDMGFALVYDLSRALFPKGFDLKPGEIGRNGDTSGHDNDGGYALKQPMLKNPAHPPAQNEIELPRVPTIAVFVRGGCVQDVCFGGGQVRVIVVDFDTDGEGNGIYTDPDTGEASHCNTATYQRNAAERGIDDDYVRAASTAATDPWAPMRDNEEERARVQRELEGGAS